MSSRLTFATALILVSSTFLVSAEEVKEAQVGDIKLKIPEAWEQSEPTSKLRLAQFKIPKMDDDKEDAELAIFSFGGGGEVKANVERWIDQFLADGRKTKITSGKSELGQYVFVDVEGTYKKPVGPPVLGKTEPMEGARMLAAILAVEESGSYFLKMTGQKATVTAAEEAFRASFGAKKADEKELAQE